MGKNKQPKLAEVTLSYPLPIRAEREKITRTLQLAKGLANRYLEHMYNEETLTHLAQSSRKAYKVLEPIISKKVRNIPSRLNRGILEVVGRTLRSVNERKKIFEALSELGHDPSKWNYRQLIEKKNIYAKAEYVRNLAEQTQNYIQASHHFPEDYFELQGCPQVKVAALTYAPDDNQAIRIEECDGRLKVELKVVIGERDGKVEWEWVKLEIPLPKELQNLNRCKPDLRLANIHGEYLPVLDYKFQIQCRPKSVSGRFITVDWGTRKLITLCVFDEQGKQISQPIFLDFGPIKKKLRRIRKEIDRLKSKRDKLPRNSSGWHKYNQEIAKRWRKFRAIGKALSHLAANVIVLVAQIYGCSDIYVEWLKGLKSKKFGAKLNWEINTTVRQKIYDLVQYKAKLVGIKLQKPLTPGLYQPLLPQVR